MRVSGPQLTLVRASLGVKFCQKFTLSEDTLESKKGLTEHVERSLKRESCLDETSSSPAYRSRKMLELSPMPSEANMLYCKITKMGNKWRAESQLTGAKSGLSTGNCNANEPYERSEGRVRVPCTVYLDCQL